MLLQETGLAQNKADSADGFVTWLLREELVAGKRLYRARSDEFFLARIPLVSAICNSATNVDMRDRHFQVSYLKKYVSGKEEHQMVEVDGSTDITEVIVTTKDHTHERIKGCRKIVESKENIHQHQGRETCLA